MRAFIILCLIGFACADSLGYNYQPVGHSAAPGGGGSSGSSLLSSQIGSGGLGGGSLGGLGGGSLGGLGGNGGSLGGLGGGSDDGSLGGIGGGGDVAANDGTSFAPSGEFEKEFFTYSANEDEFEDPSAAEQAAQSVKQSLRVIFVKGPENRGLENAALSLAKHASDDKTAIYVLNKQADIGDLANRLNAVRNENNNKPEVQFVKYRTPEDAANAVQQIQQQLDSLGGTSKNTDGGVAPVLNFASQPAPAHGGQQAAREPGNAYLPSSIFRRFRA